MVGCFNSVHVEKTIIRMETKAHSRRYLLQNTTVQANIKRRLDLVVVGLILCGLCKSCEDMLLGCNLAKHSKALHFKK